MVATRPMSGIAAVSLAAVLAAGQAHALSPLSAAGRADRAVAKEGAFVVAAAYDATVARVQQALNRLGYDAGPDDGLMGARTRSAIEAFQRRQGLLATGRATPQLLERLQSSLGENSKPEQDDRDVRRLQRGLARLGYQVEPTGRMNARTAEAIRDYQRDEGLLVTGEASPALMGHLETTLRGRSETRRGRGDGDLVAEIEQGLQQRGYRIGTVDGRMDGDTRDAIRAYQRARGLTVTGQPTRALADMLGEGQPAALTSRETVSRVQEALNARGYQAGPADGVMGPATRQAIRDYRVRAGLPAGDAVTAPMLDRLGVTSETPVTFPTDGEQAFRQAFADDFADGEFRSSPSWRVVQGEFQVVNGALRSDVAAPASEDPGAALLRGIVSETLGVQLGGGRGAAIAQPTPFGNVFSIDAVLSGQPNGGARLSIGPYRGGDVATGYRLYYDAASSNPLSLIAVTEAGNRTLATAAAVQDLDDGTDHRIEWSRDAGGLMTVSVDGRAVMELRDRSVEGSFSGFSLINGGGTWRLNSVSVATPAG